MRTTPHRPKTRTRKPATRKPVAGREFVVSDKGRAYSLEWAFTGKPGSRKRLPATTEGRYDLDGAFGEFVFETARASGRKPSEAALYYRGRRIAAYEIEGKMVPVGKDPHDLFQTIFYSSPVRIRTA